MKTFRVLMPLVLLVSFATASWGFNFSNPLASAGSESEKALGELSARFTYMVANCDTNVTKSMVASRVAAHGLALYGEKPNMKNVGKAAGSSAAAVALQAPSCKSLEAEWTDLKE
ncbi:MAG: hypothetical protein P8K76_16150 [Candidatus Binatia bacterium]|nr:hypothetical protein [Candidatus Binatia bacterium]